MDKASLVSWKESAKSFQQRDFRQCILELYQRGLVIVRKDTVSDRIELIPSGTMRNKMGNAGMNATTLRLFKFKG